MVRITGSEQERLQRAGNQPAAPSASLSRPWPWPRPCSTAASAKSDKTPPACTGTARRRAGLPDPIRGRRSRHRGFLQVQQGQEGGGSGAVGWETQIEQPRSWWLREETHVQLVSLAPARTGSAP